MTGEDEKLERHQSIMQVIRFHFQERSAAVVLEDGTIKSGIAKVNGNDIIIGSHKIQDGDIIIDWYFWKRSNGKN